LPSTTVAVRAKYFWSVAVATPLRKALEQRIRYAAQKGVFQRKHFDGERTLGLPRKVGGDALGHFAFGVGFFRFHCPTEGQQDQVFFGNVGQEPMQGGNFALKIRVQTDFLVKIVVHPQGGEGPQGVHAQQGGFVGVGVEFLVQGVEVVVVHALQKNLFVLNRFLERFEVLFAVHQIRPSAAGDVPNFVQFGLKSGLTAVGIGVGGAGVVQLVLGGDGAR
jgi:hypothetical protein